MANEITVNTTLNVSKGYLIENKSATLNVTMNGTHKSSAAQTIATTTAGVALSIASDVATAGYAHFRNCDTTNYVDIGVQVAGTFYPLLRLKAGEAAVARLSTTTVYARANTASVVLEWLVIED